MTPETVVLAAVVAAAVTLVRSHAGLVRSVWREATWWEKAVLALALLPVPGPVDEVAGALVVRRVVKRRDRS